MLKIIIKFITIIPSCTLTETPAHLISLTGQSISLPDLSLLNLSPEISILIPPKYPLNSTQLTPNRSIPFAKYVKKDEK